MSLPEARFDSTQSQSITFAIDRGGTFTDVVCEYPVHVEDQQVYGKIHRHVMKLLSVNPNSYPNAPVEAVRRCLCVLLNMEHPVERPLPQEMTKYINTIRMGTTVATNALLERKGTPVVFVVTAGLEGLLEIGDQTRPKIFDLNIPERLNQTSMVCSARERVRVVPTTSDMGVDDYLGDSEVDLSIESSQGRVEVLQKLDEADMLVQLENARMQGQTSVAVALAHSYAYPDHELIVEKLARQVGFTQVTQSHQISREPKLLARAYTACVDAYLTPCIRDYLDLFLGGFEDSDIEHKMFIQSDGTQTSANKFCGYRAILSGPAGGIVGIAKTAFFTRETALVPSDMQVVEKLLGYGTSVLGFDMGGTSTDVSRYTGSYHYVQECVVAGVQIRVPQLDISTVAAGGNSILHCSDGQLHAGPHSAGSYPGSACYGNGGPATITDANLVAGRLVLSMFPKVFGPEQNEPLHVDAAMHRMGELAAKVNAIRATQGLVPLSVQGVALAFLEVAEETMARPMRLLLEGEEARSHALGCFGAAGGQHACGVAEKLGVRKVLVHAYSSVQSAYGILRAEIVGESMVFVDSLLSDEDLPSIRDKLDALPSQALQDGVDKGGSSDGAVVQTLVEVSYVGSQSTVELSREECSQNAEAIVEAVKNKFLQKYGFFMERKILMRSARCRATSTNHPATASGVSMLSEQPITHQTVHFYKNHQVLEADVPVYPITSLEVGVPLAGPCVLADRNTTVLVNHHWTAIRMVDGIALFHAQGRTIDELVASLASANTSFADSQQTRLCPCEGNCAQYGCPGFDLDLVTADHPANPTTTSLFSHRFMSIAEQMGVLLSRVAISINIRDRLDFSCGIFSTQGIIANAPHLPVHLGSMAAVVTAVIDYEASSSNGLDTSNYIGYQSSLDAINSKFRNIKMQPGDVIVTNDPAMGGSHLPDITVISPLFLPGCAKPVFYLASRGHHADVGGIASGSMPANSKSLQEEGEIISYLLLVRNGEVNRDGMLAALKSSRRLNDNENDLLAQAAANKRGAVLLQNLLSQYGEAFVLAQTVYVQHAAASSVREMLKHYSALEHRRQMSQTADNAQLIRFMKENAVEPRTNYQEPAQRAHFNGLTDDQLIEQYCGIQCTPDERKLPNAVVFPAVKTVMDDGSQACLQVTVSQETGECIIDFTGSTLRVHGNTNTPRSVVSSAVIYVLRCLTDSNIPLNQGCLNGTTIIVPPNSFLLDGSNDQGVAIVGGNVTTSQVLVNLLLESFGRAHGQGCMNNLTLGVGRSTFYTTLGGGSGAAMNYNGTTAQINMTNTALSEIEILERSMSVMVKHLRIREKSGGIGAWRGGNGLVFGIKALRSTECNILSEGRTRGPRGIYGGKDGLPGRNVLVRHAESTKIWYGQEQKTTTMQNLAPKDSARLNKGDEVIILTAGGGGYCGFGDLDTCECWCNKCKALAQNTLMTKYLEMGGRVKDHTLNEPVVVNGSINQRLMAQEQS